MLGELLGAPRVIGPDDAEYPGLLTDLKRVTVDGYARSVSFV